MTPPYNHLGIRTCENGWEVSPRDGNYRAGDCTVLGIYVFETWDSLTEWLGENLEDPADSA